MTRTSRSIREVLTEAEVHLQLAQTYACESVDEQVVVDAICMRLSARIDSLSRLDPAVRDELFGESWEAIWGMRNRIAHERASMSRCRADCTRHAAVLT